VEFAQRLEQALGRTGPTLFPYTDAESIWNEHRESTRGRDLDITGLSYALLDAAPQQWPFAQGAQTGRVRLYEDGIFPTADGRARFVAEAFKPVAEPRDARFPFALNTGRLRDQWHGMSRTGTLGRLFGHVREPALQMHPQDMARRLLNEGDLVQVSSRRGAIVLPVQGSAEQGMGEVFLGMHWGEEFISGRSSTGERLAGVNALTSPAFCPDSKQPEFKHAAVKVQKAELPWSLLAMAWLPEDQALQARLQLQHLMAEFPFASCVPFANTPAAGAAERQGVLFRAAALDAAPAELLERVEAILQLQGAEVLRYADAKRGQRRAMRLLRVGADTRVDGFLLAGDTSAQGWVSSLLQEEQAAQAYGRALLLPVATPPVAVVSKGRVVCTCLQVRDIAIEDNLRMCSGSPSERLAKLQGALQCGTQCGSCVPELQRIVRSVANAPILPLLTATQA
jgi:assimilatory nitrate reductase catalytic subunit